VGATLLALLLAVAAAAALHDRTALRWARPLLAPLLAVPHLAAAAGFAFLVAPSGLIIRCLSPWMTGLHQPPDIPTLQDPWGVALAVGLGLREAPFLLLAILAAQEQRCLEHPLAAARTLGCGPVGAWLKIALPAVWPLVRLPTLAVLVFGLSVVDVAIVLGPNAPPTFAVLLLDLFQDVDLDHRLEASAGALLLLGVVGLAALALAGLEVLARRYGRGWASTASGPRAEVVYRTLGGAAAALVLGAGALSILALALWSVAGPWPFPRLVPESLDLRTLIGQLPALAGPFGTTLGIALASATMALAASIGCLEHETEGRAGGGVPRLLWLIYLPLLVPQISFLFGLEILFLDLGIDATWPALVWSHLVFVLPYTFLMLREPYRRLDRRLVAAGRTLGRGQGAVWARIKLPLLRTPLLVAFAIGFSVSVAQYLPTLLIGAGRFRTLTTETLALAASGDRRLTGVTAFVLAALPLVPLMLALSSAAARRGPRRRPR
jgi:putative thiamine transport system permease protein